MQNSTEDVADRQEITVTLEEQESKIRVLKEQLAMKEKQLQDSIQNLAEQEICSVVKKKPLQDDETQLGNSEKDAELCSVRREVANLEEILAQFKKCLLEKERELDMIQKGLRGSATMVCSLYSLVNLVTLRRSTVQMHKYYTSYHYYKL